MQDHTSHPQDPIYAERVRASFTQQGIMATLGAQLTAVAPGRVKITMPFNAAFTQQHGFMHAGVVATIADSACGYAAFTLMPTDAAVLTVEYKINMLRPAAGDRFVAEARVVRPGGSVTVCICEVYAWKDDNASLCALLTATIATVRGKAGIEH